MYRPTSTLVQYMAYIDYTCVQILFIYILKASHEFT